MVTSSRYLVAQRPPLRADRAGNRARARQCGSDFGRGEREDWKNKCARLEAGRELAIGLSIRSCAACRCGLRAVVRDGEVMASKRVPIACALRQAPPSEVPNRQLHRSLLPQAGRRVVWAGAGFGQQHLAPTRPNLALEPTSYGRPSCPRCGPLRSLSTARPSRPAVAVGSALR